jgi:hypothetical protein
MNDRGRSEPAIATPADVANCYALLLGRGPESAAVLEEAASQPFKRVFGAMLGSREFRNLIAAFARSGTLPHDGSQPYSDRIGFWLIEKLELPDAIKRDVIVADSWRTVLTALLASERLRREAGLSDELWAAIRTLPAPEHDSDDRISAYLALPEQRTGNPIICVIDRIADGCVRGWAVNRIFPNEPVRLQIVIDGALIRWVTCDLPRSDMRPHGYPAPIGFKFALPEPYADGQPHRVELLHKNVPVDFAVDWQRVEGFRFVQRPVETIRGEVEGLHSGVIRGWVLRAEAPGTKPKGGAIVSVTCEGEFVGYARSDRYRPDIAERYGADPYCGFAFDPPTILRRSYPQRFRFCVMPAGTELPRSPYVTSFAQDHLQGRLLVLNEAAERLSEQVTKLREEIAALVDRPAYTLETYEAWFAAYYTALVARVGPASKPNGRRVAAPGLSIVCPLVHPDTEDVRATVASVRAQTRPDWELILVDDGNKNLPLR